MTVSGPTAPILRYALLSLGVAAFIVVGVISTVAGSPTMLISFTGFSVVGALILARQPRNGVGWLLFGLGLIATASGLLEIFARQTGSVHVEAIHTGMAWLVWGTMPLIGLFFPTGRVQTRFGQWVLRAAIAVVGVAAIAALFGDELESGRANPLARTALAAQIDLFNSVLIYPLFFVIVICILVDVAVRWARAGSVERLQYRWLVFGLAVVIVDIISVGILSAILPDDSPWFAVFGVLGVVVNFIPVAIYIAVSRHGLYDLGRVVSRTISYGLILMVVVGIYVGVVIGVGSLVPADNPIPVAVATLIVASVFLPLLRWLQRGLDRRFDRAHYNAEAVVETFGSRLRSEVDPDTIAPELLATVDRTFQPTTIGLWTR
ncbi:hypothetical protein [Microbacterium sp. bgisy189]|uniref:hypothetical protein n=1 Tax=Microbacterium sp. bgisy189 TaxID=3413798 RepID=UPI003EC13B6C